MLYRTLKRLIEKGMTEGLAEKIDVFFATGKLSDREYFELTSMLPLEMPIEESTEETVVEEQNGGE